MLRKRKKAVSLVLMAFLFLLPSTMSFALVCGDVDCSGGDPDITDITRLIDFLYLSHNPLCYPLLADVNDSGGEPDVSDITTLIEHLYLTHEPLVCPPPAIIMDIDFNTYHTIKIGNQWWLKENLRVTRYRNGQTIPNVTDKNTWQVLSTGAYCCYNNDEGTVATYGLLYNWYAVNDGRHLAPWGWHIPSDEEWRQLEINLGMSPAQSVSSGWRGTDEGGKLKEIGTIHWISPNYGATNETGFTAIPSGTRWFIGTFGDINEWADFWSSVEKNSNYAPARHLYYLESRILAQSMEKRTGLSVRCVRD